MAVYSRPAVASYVIAVTEELTSLRSFAASTAGGGGGRGKLRPRPASSSVFKEVAPAASTAAAAATVAAEQFVCAQFTSQ